MTLETANKIVDNKLQQMRDFFIEAMSRTMALYGFNPTVGRLYGVLFFARKPMMLEEMCEALKISKTSVCTTIKILVQVKAAQQVWQRGVRKDMYVADRDFFKYFIDFFCNNLRNEVALNFEALNTVIPLYEETISKEDDELKIEAKEDLDRLLDVKKYYVWLDKFVKTYLDTLKIFELVPIDEESES